MLAIGSALIAEPRLLILDEPVSGLSPHLTAEVARGIAEISRSGVTVIWVVEESPQQVIGLSDEVAVMSGGTITLRQPAAAMLAADNFRELFLGI
jgi:ABC-type branched-subunit amino acid transport system ATPase component